jgi:hypothetical protein
LFLGRVGHERRAVEGPEAAFHREAGVGEQRRACAGVIQLSDSGR